MDLLKYIPCKYRLHRPMIKASNKQVLYDIISKKPVYLWRCDCEKIWMAPSKWGFRVERKIILDKFKRRFSHD